MSEPNYADVARSGLFAGYQGISPLSNPHTAEREAAARKVWFDNWTEGSRCRRRDRRNGAHPDVVERSEFGVQAGHRAGVSVGARN